MDGRRSAHRLDHAHRRADDYRGVAARLRDSQPFDFLPGHRIPGGWPGGSRPTREILGAIPQLAARLSPFAGADALAIAGRLIATYGSPARALAASRESLGETLASHKELADTIAAARELSDYGSLNALEGQIVDTVSPPFLAFLQRTLGHAEDERLLGVFLDKAGHFIAAEGLATGLRADVEIALRPLIGRILELGARGLILAHNHPSGSLEPSAFDRAATRRLAVVLQAIDCVLSDHLIVTAQGCYSMARAGEL